MQILGIANSYASAPVNAPTSLSGTPSTTSVSIAFIAPTNDGGSAITNYEYSFNNSSWTALSPADATTPVTVSGLTANTAYTIYLRAVNVVGSGPGSSGLSVTTLPVFMSASGGSTVDYGSGGFTYRSHTFTGNGTFTVSTVGSFGTVDVHMIGGGGGGGYSFGGGGGGGGATTTSGISLAATGYGIVIGGTGYQGQDVGSGAAGGVGGTTTVFGLSVGGGGAGATNVAGANGAPANGGGGGGGSFNGIGPSANGSNGTAGGGQNGSSGGYGGNALNQPNAFRTGSNETYATGGTGSGYSTAFNAAAGSGYGAGGGGGGIYDQVPYRGGNAQAGAVIIRYRIA